MGAAIGDVLGLAAGVAVSPLPIVAMILLLATPRGRANGALFAVGWLVGLSVLGAVVLLLAGPTDPSDDGQPAAWTGWLKLLLGVLLLLLAARQWRARPAGGRAGDAHGWPVSTGCDPARRWAWGRCCRRSTPRTGPDHRRGGLDRRGRAARRPAGGRPGRLRADRVAGGARPLVLYLVAGERAARTLDSWKTWAGDHNAAIMAVLFLVFGLKLVGDGIAVLF